MADSQLLREKVARLQAHNELMKSQLELQRASAAPNSRTASILQEIMKWFDNVPPSVDQLMEENWKTAQMKQMENSYRYEVSKTNEDFAETPRNVEISQKSCEIPQKSCEKPQQRCQSLQTTQNLQKASEVPQNCCCQCSRKYGETSPKCCDVQKISKESSQQREVKLQQQDSETQTDTEDMETPRPSTQRSTKPAPVPALNLSDLQNLHIGEPERMYTARPSPDFPLRILGETAFQLERRILSYVFNGQAPATGSVPARWRQRFYGFTIQNIPELIEFECTNKLTGEVDATTKMAMTYRHMNVLRILGQFGYDVNRHTIFAVNLVNNHGLLSADDRKLEGQGLQDPDVVRQAAEKLLLSVEVTDNATDFLIIFNSLVYMAAQDGRPLYIF